jgi:uncharacterized protein
MGAAENKKLMQEIFDGLAKGDPAKFLEHLAEDVIFTVTGQNSWSQTFRGKANLRRDLYGYVRSLMVENSVGTTTAIRIIVDEEWVAVETRSDNMTKAGVRYNNQYCMIYRIENGMITEIKEYLDSDFCERVLGPYPADRKAASA